MPPSTPRPRWARFGDVQLDVKAGELHAGGRRTRLRNQPHQLLERADEPFTQDAIRARLWPNDTIVEFALSISTAVNGRTRATPLPEKGRNRSPTRRTQRLTLRLRLAHCECAAKIGAHSQRDGLTLNAPSDTPCGTRSQNKGDDVTRFEETFHTVNAHVVLAMHRTFLALTVFVVIGGGTALAQGEVKVTTLSRRDVIEKLEGKAAGATVQEVTFEPGQKDSPHRHVGPVFGYVLEGEYEHALDAEPIKTYKAGETFYEPSGSVHRVAQNPSSKTRTRLLAVILHPRDAKDVTIPEKHK